MTKRIAALLVALILPTTLFADIAVTERANVAKQLHSKEANREKPAAGGKSRPGPRNIGSIELIDSQGLDYFIDTNLTFSSTTEASGAASSASYSQAVHATTMNGGTTSSTLDDNFDGYGTLCVSNDGTDGPCETENPNSVIYTHNGPPTTDSSCGGRQIDFPQQVMFGTLQVRRKVFVPGDDTFIRWQNIFTNTGSSPITFKAISYGNLGSDSATQLVTSSNGNNTAETTDTWVTSFQSFGAFTNPPNPLISTDVRNGAIMQGVGAAIPVHAIHFVDGSDRPWWDYVVTLNPGQTKIIMTFATGAPSNAKSAQQAARIATLPATTKECMTTADLSEVANFATAPAVAVPTVPALSPLAALLGAMFLALAGALAMRLRS